MAGSGAFERLLAEPLRLWLSELRAGKWWERGVARDLARRLGDVAGTHGAIRLRIEQAALTVDGEAVVEYSAATDPVPARLFRDGVRQITFLPGLAAAEMEQLMEVLTTDLSRPEHRDEDLVTLLGTPELKTIRCVFSETADSRLLEGGDLPKLMGALPEVSSDEESTEPILDARLAALRDELVSTARRPLQHLAPVVLSLLESLSAAQVERLGQILGWQFREHIRELGVADAAPHLRRVVSWITEHSGDSLGETMRRTVLQAELRGAVVASMEKADESTRKLALDVLKLLPEDQVRGAAGDLVRLVNVRARADAFVVLARGGTAALAGASGTLATLPEEEALTVVATASDAADVDESRQFFQAAAEHPEPRVRMLAASWWSRRPPGTVRERLLALLADANRDVRFATVYLAIRADPTSAVDLLRGWATTESFQRMPLDEKRFFMLLLARQWGDEAIPWLKEIADSQNVLRRQRTDEWRAVAVAAMGFLMDPSCLEIAQKLSRSPFSGTALRAEAMHVVEHLQAGTAPYADPAVDLFAFGEGLMVALDELHRAAATKSMQGSALSVAPQASADAVATLPPGPNRSLGDVVLTMPPATVAGVSPLASQGLPATPSAIAELLRAYSFDTLPPMPSTPGSPKEESDG